jgi:MoxR-like ATPase
MIDTALRTRSQVVRVLHQLQVKRQDEVLTQVTLEGELPYWFDRVYKAALCRVHQLLVGPRGSGKTMTATLLAQALELPLYTVSLSQGVDEGVLQGWLLPTTDGLKFGYVRSPFVRGYEEGGVVLLDELDGADNNVLMILHAALSNGRWDIPLRGENAPPLRRHPNFICLAAANTHGHGADRVYVGRQQLDGATLDRFAMGRLAVDYDEALEKKAYRGVHVEIGQRLRARCRAQKGWTRDVSTRNIADALRLSAQFDPAEAWYGFFEDWSDGELEKVGAVRDRARMRVVLE